MRRTIARSARADVMVTVAALVIATVGLSACGGSGSSSSSATGSRTVSATAEGSSAGTRQGATTPAEGPPPAGLTPPGTKLRLGQSATVAWVPPGSFEPSKAQSGIELDVSVEAIEEGSIGDLDNLELEPGEKGAVPFYVRLRLEAPTDQGTPAEESPALSFTAIDDRGQEQGSVTFIGKFPRCEEKEAPKPFDGGASYETCLAYLMKGGGSIRKVEWNSGPAKANEVTPYFERPIVWAGG